MTPRCGRPLAAAEAVQVGAGRCRPSIQNGSTWLSSQGHGDVGLGCRRMRTDPVRGEPGRPRVELLKQWSSGLLAHERRIAPRGPRRLLQARECKFLLRRGRPPGPAAAGPDCPGGQLRSRFEPDGRLRDDAHGFAPVSPGAALNIWGGSPVERHRAPGTSRPNWRPCPGLLAEKLAAPSVTPGRYDPGHRPEPTCGSPFTSSIGHATELDRALGYEAAFRRHLLRHPPTKLGNLR